MSTDERVARERVEQACSLIQSAYRLHTLDPAETVRAVKAAIEAGVEQQAGDVVEHLARL